MDRHAIHELIVIVKRSRQKKIPCNSLFIANPVYIDRKKGVYSDSHREADPRAPGREQGRHARQQEREEDRGHPDLRV